jgi:hypothetical protein
LGMAFCWMFRWILGKSKPLTYNITRKEYMALKSVKDNNEIRILQAGKGNCKWCWASPHTRSYPVYYNQGFMNIYTRIQRPKLRGR